MLLLAAALDACLNGIFHVGCFAGVLVWEASWWVAVIDGAVGMCHALRDSFAIQGATVCYFSSCLPSAHVGVTACATPAHTWVGLT